VKGKIDKYYSTVCLLEQTFVKDNSKTINDLLAAKIAELGENILIRRFTRFQVGETLGGAPAAETPAA
jgi:elongation factor Ts